MAPSKKAIQVFKLPDDLRLVGLADTLCVDGLPGGVQALGRRTLETVGNMFFDRSVQLERENGGRTDFEGLTPFRISRRAEELSVESDLSRMGRQDLDRRPGSTTFARCGWCTHAQGRLIDDTMIVMSGHCNLLQGRVDEGDAQITHTTPCRLSVYPDLLARLGREDRERRRDIELLCTRLNELGGLFGGLAGVRSRWFGLPLHPVLRGKDWFQPGEKVWYYFQAASSEVGLFEWPVSNTWLQGEVLQVRDKDNGRIVKILFGQPIWGPQWGHDPVTERIMVTDNHFTGLLAEDEFNALRGERNASMARVWLQMQNWKRISFTTEETLAALARM